MSLIYSEVLNVDPIVKAPLVIICNHVNLRLPNDSFLFILFHVLYFNVCNVIITRTTPHNSWKPQNIEIKVTKELISVFLDVFIKKNENHVDLKSILSSKQMYNITFYVYSLALTCSNRQIFNLQWDQTFDIILY